MEFLHPRGLQEHCGVPSAPGTTGALCIVPSPPGTAGALGRRGVEYSLSRGLIRDTGIDIVKKSLKEKQLFCPFSNNILHKYKCYLQYKYSILCLFVVFEKMQHGFLSLSL